MNKQQFLTEISSRLKGIPEHDIKKSLDYYSEMIADRMEDGLAEADAVSAVGSVEEIVSQILSESTPLILPKTRRTPIIWEIILLILGSPVWLPLLLAAAIVILAVYIVIWSAILTLYAIDLSLAAGGILGAASAFMLIFSGYTVQAVLFFGTGLILAGISILLFFGFNQITKYTVILSKEIFVLLKKCIKGK